LYSKFAKLAIFNPFFSSSFIDFEIWDLPGPLESDEFAMPFAQVGAVIFVIDAQVCIMAFSPW
jgi:hypothetical protein